MQVTVSGLVGVKNCSMRGLEQTTVICTLPAFFWTLIMLVMKLTPAADACSMTTVLLGAINQALLGLNRFTLKARSVMLDRLISGMEMEWKVSPGLKVRMLEV